MLERKNLENVYPARRGTKDGGLNCFKDGRFVSYRESEDGLPGNDVSCLYVDNDGSLWVGTSGHGLARFHQGQWTRYTRRDGLVSNSISYLIGDDTGNLWVGSNLGLMRISKKILDAAANGSVNFAACRIYGEADGLPTRECSAARNPPRAAPAMADCGFPPSKAWRM
jgi:hypothetical protein